MSRPSLLATMREPESASMWAPRVGSTSPKGEAAEESRHTKGTGPLAWVSPSTGGETSEEHVDILDQESDKGREGTTRTYSP